MAVAAIAAAVTVVAAQTRGAGASPQPRAPQAAQGTGAFVAVQAPVVALEHVRVIDGTGAPPLEDQTVVIAAGKIAALGQSGQVAVPAAARRLDLTGRSVIPGLVGLHEHLFYPNPDDAALYKVHRFSFPRLYLAGGVTTARTGGTFEPLTDLAIKKEIDEGRAIGPKLLVTAGYMDGRPLSTPQMSEVSTPQQARQFVERWAAQGAHSFKVYRHIPRLALAEAVRAAHERGLTVTGHLCSVSFREAAELGIDNLEHGFVEASDWVFAKQPDECSEDQPHEFAALDIDSPKVKALITTLVEKHVAITSTLAVTELPEPSARFRAALEPETLERYLARRRQTVGLGLVTFEDSRKEVALERAFVAAGGLLVAGCDPTGDGQVLPGFGDQRNVEMLVAGGFSPLEAIRIATLNGAQFLGLQASVGSIAVGKQADLVVLDGNPAQRIEDIERVVTVFKDGVGWDAAALVASVNGLVGLR